MENFWNVADVAAVVKVSVQTVYRYVANGKIPFHKLNRAVRFKPSEIESWLESRKAGFQIKTGLFVEPQKADCVLPPEDKTEQK